MDILFIYVMLYLSIMSYNDNYTKDNVVCHMIFINTGLVIIHKKRWQTFTVKQYSLKRNVPFTLSTCNEKYYLNWI